MSVAAEPIIAQARETQPARRLRRPHRRSWKLGEYTVYALHGIWDNHVTLQRVDEKWRLRIDYDENDTDLEPLAHWVSKPLTVLGIIDLIHDGIQFDVPQGEFLEMLKDVGHPDVKRLRSELQAALFAKSFGG